jgi:RNA polymerase sigma-70 factor (ECF subfamily)
MVDDPSSFSEFIRRLRAGDREAAEELVRRYEPEILRTIRVRLSGDRLRRKFDSEDIFLSVFGRFMVWVKGSDRVPQTPGELAALLVTMAKHRIVTHAQKAGNRHEQGADSALWAVIAGREPPPDGVAVDRELAARLFAEVGPEDRQLLELRADGCSWQEVGDRLGLKADAARKRHERLVAELRERFRVSENSDVR